MEMDCGSDPAMTESRAPRRRGVVTRLLDRREAHGRVLFTSGELAEEGQLSLLAVQRQLAHLGARVARLPGRPEAFLLVAPEHRERGAPPVLWWLGAYMRLRRQSYYVGLLSAAELHGSSQQAVQVVQVLTNKVTRPICTGRLRIEFHVKKTVDLTPSGQPPGMHAPSPSARRRRRRSTSSSTATASAAWRVRPKSSPAWRTSSRWRVCVRLLPPTPATRRTNGWATYCRRWA